jgi:thymidylate kinase
MKKQCKIIAFEGIDAIGKATQSIKLTQHLSKKHKAIRIEFPIEARNLSSANITFKMIKYMLKNGMAKKLPNTFQVIQFLNKASFQLFWLNKLKKKYDYIVLDRWSLSMWSYGLAAGVNKNVIKMMIKAVDKPDVNVILQGKSFPKEDVDTYETDVELQRAVHTNYLKAGSDKSLYNLTYCFINANDDQECVHNNIIKSLERQNIL